LKPLPAYPLTPPGYTSSAWSECSHGEAVPFERLASSQAHVTM